MQDDLRKFKFLSDKASDGYLLVDRKARFHYVNEAACRMSGYLEEDGSKSGWVASVVPEL